MYSIPNIKDAVIAVTYKCNSQCIACNIGRKNVPDDLDLEYYERLPTDLRNIGISGGEPTLRDDIVELIDIIRIRCKRAKLTFSTNGLLVNKIEMLMSKIYKVDRNIGIAVSVDGLSDTNDKVRGVKDSFHLAINTIKILKRIGFNDIRISFNICDENVREMHAVYKLSEDLKVAFTCNLIQNSINYFQKTDNVFTKGSILKEALNFIIRKELNSVAPKKWFVSYYDYGLYYLHTYKTRLLKCGALRDFFFLDPNGDIYPCIFRPEIIGNLKKCNYFFEIWESQRTAELRESIKRCSTACWQLCTARTSILNNIIQVSLWVLKKKLLAVAKKNII